MDAPPGMMPRADALALLAIDEATLEQLVAAGVIRASPDGAWIDQVSAISHMAGRLGATVRAVSARTESSWLNAIEGFVLPLLVFSAWFGSIVQLWAWRDGDPILHPAVFFAGIAGVLAASAWLARRQHDLHSINGFGTSMYGRSRGPDGLIGTAWVVAMMVPLVPYASFVLLESSEETRDATGSRQSLMLRQRPGIHWPQASRWMLASWTALLGAGALLVLWV